MKTISFVWTGYNYDQVAKLVEPHGYIKYHNELKTVIQIWLYNPRHCFIVGIDYRTCTIFIDPPNEPYMKSEVVFKNEQ